MGGFLSNPVAKKLLVEFTTAISIRQIMDTKKILLVNLSKGQIGEDASSLLGALLLHSVGLAAFSRADMPKYMRIPFYLYADEFQNFTTQSIANMQSEIRKFSVCTCYAAQYLSAIQSDIKDAILGNVGTLIVFRLGVTDAKYFEKEFYPYFSFEDIINLPNYKIYLKLMIDGSPSKPFSADCMLHIPRKTTG